MCTCRLFVCDKCSWQRAALSDDFNIKAFPLRLIWSCSWNSALLRLQTGFRKLANFARSPETSEDDANAQPEYCCWGSLRRDSLMWFTLLMGSPQVRYWLLNGTAGNGSPPSSSQASIFQGLWALAGGHGHTLLKATGGQIKDSAVGKEEKKDIKNTTASHRVSRQPCAAFWRWMMDAIAGGCLLEPMHQRLRQIKNWTSRGFSHSERSERPGSRKTSNPAMPSGQLEEEGNWGDCAMLCVPGNKEIRSPQRRL